MAIYFKSSRNGQLHFTSYQGMTEATILNLMSELGHTDIEAITAEEFLEEGQKEVFKLFQPE